MSISRCRRTVLGIEVGEVIELAWVCEHERQIMKLRYYVHDLVWIF